MSKGKFLEDVINRANDGYLYHGIALVDKVETAAAIKPGHDGGKRVVYKAAPKVDYSGKLRGGVAIGFEAKESEHESGLPLSYFRQNQIDYMRLSVPFGGLCFVVAYSVTRDKFYRIPAARVLEAWDLWQQNKGKRGYNAIAFEDMDELRSRDGIVLDYLHGMYDPCQPAVCLDGYSVYRFMSRGKKQPAMAKQFV